MAGIWTPTSARQFYRAIKVLQNTSENPLFEESYEIVDLREDNAINYTLPLRDELQFVNHIAFLAHSQEGVKAVSAVCLEERDTGLVLCLASNRNPTQSTKTGLRSLLECIRDGSRKQRRKSIFRQQLFEKVLELSKDRISQRIRPSGSKAPFYFRGTPEETLWSRLEKTFLKVSSGVISEEHSDLRTRLEELIDCLKKLDSKVQGAKLTQTLTTIIYKCAEISYWGGSPSLEHQLRQLGLFTDRREISQIDKLARYLGLCKDIAKIVRGPAHVLFQTIDLEILDAYPAIQPPGILKQCYVHAEVQLILHYEKRRLLRPPRAIGCSKSACFLCDMLIQKLGKYCISHAHRRLYDQWAIPESPWMTTEQVALFRGIIKSMTEEMKSLKVSLLPRREVRPYGLESRTCLPLPAGTSTSSSESAVLSDASTVTLRPKESIRSLRVPSPLSENHLKCPITERSSTATVAPSALPDEKVSQLELSTSELPLHHEIRADSPPLCLHLQALSLTFEFMSVSAGKLRVTNVEKDVLEDGDGVRRFDVLDVPLSDTRLIPKDSAMVRFQLQYAGVCVVELEFVWEN